MLKSIATPPINVAKIAKFSYFQIISGRQVPTVSIIEPQAPYIPNIMRMRHIRGGPGKTYQITDSENIPPDQKPLRSKVLQRVFIGSNIFRRVGKLQNKIRPTNNVSAPRVSTRQIFMYFKINFFKIGPVKPTWKTRGS